MPGPTKVSIVFFATAIIAIATAGWWYNNSKYASISEQNIPTANTSSNASPMENLKIMDVVAGTGAEAKNGSIVTVDYTGTFDDGTQFDSSYGKQPLSFVLGAGGVIKGWDLGLLGMKVGGKRELVVPSALGYGANGYPPIIPPNATLHFAVELLAVNPR